MQRQGGSVSGLSFLVVEDEVYIAMAMEDALLKAGADAVEIAMTLNEAKSRLDQSTYDAAILDLRLPDGETFDIGLQLLEQAVPLIIHSGHADLGHAKRLPGAVFCSKPSTPDDLLKAAAHALAGRMEPNASTGASTVT